MIKMPLTEVWRHQLPSIHGKQNLLLAGRTTASFLQENGVKNDKHLKKQ